MTNITTFIPRAELDASQRLAEFVALARALTGLIPGDEWDSPVWDVTRSFVRKGKPNVVSRLHLFRHNSLDGRGDASTGVPFSQPYGDFVRATVRYQHSVAPKVFERLKARLLALSHIDAGFESLGMVSDVTKLSTTVLFAAVRIGVEGVGGAVAYQRAAMIQSIFEFCRQHGLLSTPFVWKHGVSKAADAQDRIGEAFAERREAKLPSRKCLDVLAHAYCEPQNLRDKVFTAVTAICMCVPIRLHEVLQLSMDCGCEEERRNLSGHTVPAFGFRVYPGKGNLPQIKWVADVMADLGQEAVARLQVTSASARTIARWYASNPTMLYLPPELEHLRYQTYISVGTLAHLAGVANGVQWATSNGLAPVRLGSGKGFSYKFSDFEAIVILQLPKDFPFQNGNPNLTYTNSLILVNRFSMRADTVGPGSRVMFEAITLDHFGMWLSGSTGRKSVFERYGFEEDDGARIEQTSHGFRHWLNDIAHRQGLGALDIAHWSGRDPAQNKYYDHQTPQQFHKQLLEFSEKAGGIGRIFEAANDIGALKLISRKEFLGAHMGSSHQTDLGACVHDYSLLPCQKHGNCLDCDENVFIKGDVQHRSRIAARHSLTLQQLAAARTAMEDEEYGSDLWVKDHTASLRRLAQMLAIHDDPQVTDGTVVNLPADSGDTEVSLAVRERDRKSRAS